MSILPMSNLLIQAFTIFTLMYLLASIKNKNKLMKKLIVILCLLSIYSGYSQSEEEADKKAIQKVLKKQLPDIGESFSEYGLITRT